MSDNIKVAIKVRPLINRENDERLPIQWIVEKNAILQIDPETKKRADAQFHFDYIFDMGQSNQDVFDATVKPIVEAAMNGMNGTIFAYGQTGSGKTYTMMGTKEEYGVIPLTVNYIFNYIRNDSSREFLLRVSYIEIYNEKINDLLDKKRTDLKIKEDTHGHIGIDCKEEVTNSADCVLQVMRRGDKNRRIGETNMNDRSSRSHTIFRITIESCAKSDPDGTAKEAQLNLIDLAGSERARQTGATGERFNEGRHINLSLSTLSLVIKQLSESQSCNKYINYRDSKLTRILQPSLGGNAMTTVICAVTPAADYETQCTLDFAVRAKGVKNKPQVNENVSDKALLKRIRTQKAKLEAEMQNIKTELAEKDKQLLRGRIALMNMQILTSNSQNEEEFRIKARRRRTWGGTSTGGTNLSSSPCFALPTINECEQKSDNEMEELIQRESIYGIDMLNQSFQTAFADFELQLIEDQREKNRLSNGSDCSYIPPSVTTRPQIIVEIDDTENMNVCNPERTPERRQSACNSHQSPGTPKNELREKVNKLRSEYDNLREFTTLEKQLLQSDCIAAPNQYQYEKNFAYITKSLTDSEQLCKDLNKKYAELQSDYAILTEKYEASEHKCEMLVKEMNSLSILRDSVNSIELERNEYKSNMNEALNRQKNLEDEIASSAFEIDLLKTKYKGREKELEASLKLAWQDFIDPNEKQKFTDVIHLQSVIVELTNKISSLESQLNIDTQSNSLTENFILKIDEADHSFEKCESEYSASTKKLPHTIEGTHNKMDETTLTNEFKMKTAEYIERIAELEKIIAQRDFTLIDTNNHAVVEKFSEANNKLQMYENRIEAMSAEIDKLQSDLREKSNELGEIKFRLNGLVEESEKKSRETELQSTMNKEQLESAILANKDKELEISEMKQLIMTRENEFNKSNAPSKMTAYQSVTNKSINSIVENSQDYDDKLTQLEQQHSEIIRLHQLFENAQTDFSSTIKTYQDKINELTIENEKIKKQIANLEKDGVTYDNNQLTMDLLLQEKDNELQKISKLESQLECAMSERKEFEKIIAEQHVQLNEHNLMIENTKKYESEAQDLNSHNEYLQSVVKKLEIENEEIKREFESAMNSLKMLENEKESLMKQLELLNTHSSDAVNTKNISRRESTLQITLSNDTKTPPRVCQVVKPLSIVESAENTKKIRPSAIGVDVTNDDKESSSIFANGSYFDNMDVSVSVNETADLTVAHNSSDVNCTITNPSLMESKLDLDDSKILLNLTSDQLDNCLSQKNAQELASIIKELLNLKIILEEENVKLSANLEMKIRETVGIKNDFGAFKLDFEKLQQTILLLTTENSDMTTKLSLEKERAYETEIILQKQIDELKMQVDALINEKHTLDINLKLLQEKLDQPKNSMATDSNEEMEKIIANYKNKIKFLSDENTELSNNLIEKIEELENIKNIHSQQCDDNCSYRERWEHLSVQVKILENENIELSENLVEKIKDFEDMTENYESLKNDMTTKMNNKEELTTKVNALVNLIEELKVFNSKLPDIKLMMCQCTHQTELTETRHAIKYNMALLNDRLHMFQENFERIRAEAEKLTIKTNQDVDTSVHDASINRSAVEIADITIVEEKVQRLQSEFETIHNNLQKWSTHSEKSNDADKSYDHHISILETSRQSSCESPRTSKRDAMIDRRQDELVKCKTEKQQLMKTVEAFEKFQNNMTHMHHEIKNLRAVKEVYKEKINNAEKIARTAEENLRILETKLLDITDQLNQLRGDNKQLEELNSNLNENIAKLELEKRDCETKLNELRQSILEVEKNSSTLQNQLEELKVKSKEQSSLNDKLEKYKLNISELENKIQDLTTILRKSEEDNNTLKSELHLIKSSASEQHEQNSNLVSNLQKYKENIEILESSVKELREKLKLYEEENENLYNKIAKLEATQPKTSLNVSDYNMEVCDESFTRSSDNKNSAQELVNVRACITKEIAMLQSREVENLDGKSVSELFSVFLTALLAKEQEIVKTLIHRHEQEKHDLVEQRKQCIDAEKRSNAWAKVLETDIERLQSDLTKQETKNSLLSAEISKLENLLLDSDHEKQLLKDKMTLMETDFNILQTDYEKHTKANLQSDDATNEREKWVQEAIEQREIEFKARITKLEDEYKKKIDEVCNLLESVKTKNFDLKRELEALEANERQFKCIIDLKSNEIIKANSKIQRLEEELKNLTEHYKQSNDDNQLKTQKIDEITALLKTKCDKMSEYKTQLETINPEYETLKIQASERQLRLETYKSEIEKLRAENLSQLSSMKDKLDIAEIKSTSLNKQLADITNRNTVIQSELLQLQNKCKELECANERLVKKVRNSTSKLTVEREMEDLRDENRTQLKNLEGATNRIVELQKQKSELMKDHIDLQTRYKQVCREKIELKDTLDRSKIVGNNTFELHEKYDALLQEKNKIALALEEKRSIVVQLEIKLEKLVLENTELKEKNTELDAEMDDIVKKIHEMDEENTELQRKVYEMEKNNTDNDSNKESMIENNLDLNNLKSRYDEMKRGYEVVSMTAEMLKKENTELKHKVGQRNEGKSCGSSRNSSPTPTSRSRQRRSDLFNQNRPLESTEDIAEAGPDDCQCKQLRKEIVHLEQDLVSKKARVATLELQIKSQMFPYETKCAELQSAMFSYKQHNMRLLAENNELRTKRIDCVRCMNWKSSQQHQTTQTSPTDEKISLSSGGSKNGIVEEYMMEQAKIRKLEKEKQTLKLQLKRRIDERLEMREKIKELQNQLEILRSGHSISDKNFKLVMKENVPANFTGQLKLIAPPRKRIN